jgi:hypothetical protein
LHYLISLGSAPAVTAVGAVFSAIILVAASLTKNGFGTK